MIPQAYITDWRSKTAPWSSNAQVEQDLILSRVLIELYSSPLLSKNFAFRGGTALQKLFLNPAARYSEDIDLVQIDAGPIGPLMSEIRKCIDPWLGKSKWKHGEGRTTFYYRVESEIQPIEQMKIKIEINTREHNSFFGLKTKEFLVNSPWKKGTVNITTYSIEELLATKLRALYQRKKGRDLFDFGCFFDNQIQWQSVVDCFNHYMKQEGQIVTRALFEENLLNKIEQKSFNDDIRPLITSEQSENYNATRVASYLMKEVVCHFKGDPWKREEIVV